MSESTEEAPPPPRRGRWTLAFLLACVGASVIGVWFVGQRAAELDALVARFHEARDQYIVGVCHDAPQLSAPPEWAAPLKAACLGYEPQWGTEEPAREAQATAAMGAPEGGSGMITALGRFIRTFNPIIILEIFVALTVAFFVLLGVRGGETPAETVISRLGSGVRSKWVTTAQRAAIAGVLLGAGSLVAGTWASELKEEKRLCRESAVSYAYLLGIDGRCDRLRTQLRSAEEARNRAEAEKGRCDVQMAETKAHLSASTTIEETAGHLEASLRDEQDRGTRAVLDAVMASYGALAKELARVRVETAGIRAATTTVQSEMAKEASLARLATKETQDALRLELARQEQLVRGAAKEESLQALAKIAAKEDSIGALAKEAATKHEALLTRLRTLSELEKRQCLAPGSLDPVLDALRTLRREPPVAGTPE